MAEVERSQGYVDALRELSLLVDFEKIDTIFEAFMTTNEHWGSHASARDVIGRMREFNTYYVYKHNNIRYCATTKLVHNADNLWANIKLNSNGFVFEELRAKPFAHRRHNLDGWVVVSSFQHERFPRVCAFMRSFGLDRMKIFYHHTTKRLDMKLLARADQTHPMHVVITFEAGFPYVDENEGASYI